MLPIIAALLSEGLSLTANAAIQKGSEWIKEKTGIDLSTATLKPEDILALKKWETENELELQKLNQAELQSYLLDAQSARQMQIAALGQEDLFSKRFVYYLATAWSVATMAYIGCITFVRIPAENIRYADTVLAFLLGTAVAQIFNYMYGTTRGSEAKNAVIKDVVQSSLK